MDILNRVATSDQNIYSREYAYSFVVKTPETSDAFLGDVHLLSWEASMA